MSLKPRNVLSDDFISGMTCAICTKPALHIVHVEEYPDFVHCQNCDSAFVVENEGSWVMYGKIPEDYPETREFALKQWSWLDAVSQRAEEEREERGAAEVAAEPKAEPPTPEEAPETTLVEEELTSTQHAELDKAVTSKLQQPAAEDDQFELESSEEGEMEFEFEADSVSPFAEQMPTPPPEAADAEEDLPDWLRPEMASEVEGLIEEEEPEVTFEERPQAEPEEEAIMAAPPTSEGAPAQEIEEGFELELEEELLEPTPFAPPSRAQPVEGTTPQPSEEPFPPEPGEEDTARARVGEPEPDKRFRVVVRGSQLRYPKNVCAHCLRKAEREMRVSGRLPDPNQPGERKTFDLRIPLCSDCHKRTQARSADENNSRLQGLLISGVVGLLLMVVTLATGVINLQEDLLLGLGILGLIALLGFGIPAIILLSRASRFPPPRDAVFVLTTLLIQETADDLTQFEWRNPGYGEFFRQVNRNSVEGGLQAIKDRAALAEFPTEDETQLDAFGEES
jgi:hypothetical protein